MLKRALLGLSLAIVMVGGVFVYNAMAAITTVTVTAPDGGEVWADSHNIIWTSDGSGGETILV